MNGTVLPDGLTTKNYKDAVFKALQPQTFNFKQKTKDQRTCKADASAYAVSVFAEVSGGKKVQKSVQRCCPAMALAAGDTVQRQPAPKSPEKKPRNKLKEFIEWVENRRGTGDYTFRIENIYIDEMHQNLDRWETPEALWEWARQRAADIEKKLREPTPYQRFADFYKAQRKYVDSLTRDKQLYQDALERYVKWLDAHMDDPDLGKYNPSDIWGLAFKNALPAERKRVEAENLKKIKEKNAPKLDYAAIDKKLAEVQDFSAREIYRERPPGFAEDKSAHRACLEWSAPASVRKIIGDNFIHDEVSHSTDPDFTRYSAADDFSYYLSKHFDESDALKKTHLECSDTERESVPLWRTALEVGFSLLPIVGQIMGGYEVLTGREFWTGTELSGGDRAFLAGAMLLPVAGKLYKGAKTSLTVKALRESYPILSEGEARALVRAVEPIKPGSDAALLLEKTAADLAAKKKIPAATAAELNQLLEKMGMTDEATVKALGGKSGSSLAVAQKEAERIVKEAKAAGSAAKGAAAVEIKGALATESQVTKAAAPKVALKDGHGLYVTRDGRIFRCTDDPCTELAAKYASTLDANKDLAARLEKQRDEFRKIADDEAAAEEAAAKKKAAVDPDIKKQLQKARDEANARLTALGEELSDLAYKPSTEKPLPLALPPEQAKVDEYVKALNQWSQARDAADAAGMAAADEVMSRIEQLAIDSVGKQGDYQYMLHRIETLIDARGGIRKGFVFEYFDKRLGKTVEGLGRKIECEASAFPPMAGRTYSDIRQNVLKKAPTQIEPGTKRVRLTWKYDDKSFIHIDIPSPESDKIHQISREVHVTRVAPVQKGIDLHLSDLGIGVPSNSAPAHVLIVRDAELDKIVEGALKTPAK
jgi:Pre-toxin TG/Putative RNase-like toxin, toxin_1